MKINTLVHTYTVCTVQLFYLLLLKFKRKHFAKNPDLHNSQGHSMSYTHFHQKCNASMEKKPQYTVYYWEFLCESKSIMKRELIKNARKKLCEFILLRNVYVCWIFLATFLNNIKNIMRFLCSWLCYVWWSALTQVMDFILSNEHNFWCCWSLINKQI